MACLALPWFSPENIRNVRMSFKAYLPQYQ